MEFGQIGEIDMKRPKKKRVTKLIMRSRGLLSVAESTERERGGGRDRMGERKREKQEESLKMRGAEGKWRVQGGVGLISSLSY